ncbi:hypothetical protein [Thiolapillus sp.]
MSLELKRQDLKEVAYIRILQYAANKAIGYKISNAPNNAGFTYEDIISDESIKEIDEKWLQFKLCDICNVYKSDTMLSDGDLYSAIGSFGSDNSYTFVIKSDEFMKFVSLVDHEKTASNLKVANNTLYATVAASIVALIALVISIFSVYDKSSEITIKKNQFDALKNLSEVTINRKQFEVIKSLPEKFNEVASGKAKSAVEE